MRNLLTMPMYGNSPPLGGATHLCAMMEQNKKDLQNKLNYFPGKN